MSRGRIAAAALLGIAVGGVQSLCSLRLLHAPPPSQQSYYVETLFAMLLLGVVSVFAIGGSLAALGISRRSARAVALAVIEAGVVGLIWQTMSWRSDARLIVPVAVVTVELIVVASKASWSPDW